MKLCDIMTKPVIRISPEESVAVAARTLTHYNIGAMPVCGSDGRLCGMLTDRDIVTRCLAAGRSPSATSVKDINHKTLCCQTGNGCIRGSGPYGPGADTQTAGYGQWETVRNGKPGGSGYQGGDRHRCRGCSERNKHESVQQIRTKMREMQTVNLTKKEWQFL